MSSPSFRSPALRVRPKPELLDLSRATNSLSVSSIYPPPAMAPPCIAMLAGSPAAPVIDGFARLPMRLATVRVLATRIALWSPEEAARVAASARCRRSPGRAPAARWEARVAAAGPIVRPGPEAAREAPNPAPPTTEMPEPIMPAVARSACCWLPCPRLTGGSPSLQSNT